jgi:Holliday junction resolvase
MSKARAKGTKFETDIVNFLKENGYPDAERWGSSNMDLGDIRGVPMVLEAKDHKSMTLAEWCKQAAVSAVKANKLWAVIHKRARKGTREAYVTMSLEQFVVLMRAYEESLNT